MRLSIGETIISSIGPPPVVPTAIAFSPSAPNLQDNVVIGTVVSAVSVTTSNGTAFAGVLSLTGNDAGHFSLVGNNIVTATSISGLSTPRSVTVSATQNGVTKTGTLSVIVTPVVTGNSIVVQNANGTNPVTFANLTAAFAAVQPFQHVVITGSFIDTAQLTTNNVTVRGSTVTTNGQGGAALHDAVTQAKGILYISSNDVTVQDLEMFNARATDGDANAIRWEGHNLNIVRCYIHDCDMGVESANNGILGSGYCIVDGCLFELCGSANNGSFTHNIYIGESCSYFTFKNSVSRNPTVNGHCLKSRAVATTVANSQLYITNGTGSRTVSIEAGGIVNVKNCVLQQGPNANTDFIGVGLEGTVIPGFNNTLQQCTVSDCIIIADQGLLGGGVVHFNDQTPASQLTGTVYGCTLVATVDNTFPIHYGQGQASGFGTVIDGGGNVVKLSRAAAGIAPFPAIPALLAADALAARLLDPSWTPGTWKQIINSREDDYGWLNLRFDVANGVKPGVNNMVPWSGACVDTTNKQFLVFGGGHGDSNNNSVYSFDFTTLAWNRLSEPSAPTEQIFGEWTDHTPESVHSYGSPTFIPTLGLKGTMFHTGGAYSTSDGNGGPSPLTWLFDLSTRKWTLGANNALGQGVGMMLQYDSGNNTVFICSQSSQPVYKYNITNGTYTPFSSNPMDDFHMSGSINPVNRTFVAVAAGVNDNGTAHLINEVPLDTGLRNRPPMAGDLTFINGNVASPGFDWDSTSHVFVGWGNPITGAVATDIFLCTPPATVGGTYTWTKHSAAGGGDTPTAGQPLGTFGRFRYVPSHNCYVLVNDVTQNVYFYKKNF